MARRGKKGSDGGRRIEAYEHGDKERVNNPPVGLVTPATDPESGGRKRYAYDPHLDPQLVWAGKAERTSFDVPTVSLHVHERIDPKTILEAVQKKGKGEGSRVAEQPSLFEAARENPPLREAIEFYRHAHGWSNRLVAGDSLVVMNSLLEKEGMAGKVQMIYMDPPYGIKYGSNFQPFVNKRDVKDGKDEDLTQEPEMIRAFRDTWELGIHSYLSYLRDRLLLARELLADSGSCFVQISDENVHHVRELMDEVFGTKNAVVTIVLKKKGATTPTDAVNDFVLWYGRDRDSVRRNVRRLYQERCDPEDDPKYNTLVSDSGDMIRIKNLSRTQIMSHLESGWKWARVNYPIVSQHYHPIRSKPYNFLGRDKECGANRQWSFDVPEGLDRLALANRLFDGGGESLGGVVFWDDWPYVALSNVWNDLKGEENPEYVVQTSWRALERCLLMATDPGDLVLDPTCGSGTTAYVAEQWGRRWITCDTSRVALTLAKQRLMTALYDYYELDDPAAGVSGGFRYKTVPHVTLKSIANNPEIVVNSGRGEVEGEVNSGQWIVDSGEGRGGSKEKGEGQELATSHKSLSTTHDSLSTKMTREQIDAAIARHADQETLYDQPFLDKKKARVSGPFTLEAVPAPSVRPITEVSAGAPAPEADLSVARSGETLRQEEWRSELLKCGIRGKGGQTVEFSRVEPLAGTRHLHADAETKDAARTRVVVSFGPESAPLEQRQVAGALEEANLLVPKPGIVAFAAFHFDPEAAKDIDETNWPGVTLLKVQMNTDLLTEDLKKKRASNESFWMVGQPDVVVVSEQWVVGSEQWIVGSEQWIVDSEQGIGDGKREALAPYDIIAKLSGVDSLAKINEIDRGDLSLCIAIAERGDLWAAVAGDKGGRVDPGKHRGGAGEARDGGVSPLSGHRAGLPGRIGNSGDSVRRLGLLSERERRELVERLRGNREIADRARQIAASLTGKLSTIHYAQVTIHGFDYYNPKNGRIVSGDASQIALWLLDTDYDGRSLFPRQVFFPMAGDKEGWARLAKNLKAEIDEDRIDAYRGTVSLPFELGEHRRIAVKIVDDRGIESLKIVEVE